MGDPLEPTVVNEEEFPEGFFKETEIKVPGQIETLDQEHTFSNDLNDKWPAGTKYRKDILRRCGYDRDATRMGTRPDGCVLWKVHFGCMTTEVTYVILPSGEKEVKTSHPEPDRSSERDLLVIVCPDPAHSKKKKITDTHKTGETKGEDLDIVENLGFRVVEDDVEPPPKDLQKQSKKDTQPPVAPPPPPPTPPSTTPQKPSGIAPPPPAPPTPPSTTPPPADGYSPLVGPTPIWKDKLRFFWWYMTGWIIFGLIAVLACALYVIFFGKSSFFFGSNKYLPLVVGPQTPTANPTLITDIFTLTRPTNTPTYTPTNTSTPISTATSTPSPTSTPTVTPSPTPVVTPTPVKLRGTIQQRSNVRYGPGAPFLYKYGVRTGTPMEVIGRDVDGGWLYVQAVGGHNPGWINANLMQVNGDVMSLPEVNPDIGLPVSTFYGPPTVTSVSFNGIDVTVVWSPIVVRVDLLPGEGIPIYVVEVWTCKGGKKTFAVIGTNNTTVTFTIDGGCGQASQAIIRLQFKEGFSTGQVIPLPQ